MVEDDVTRAFMTMHDAILVRYGFIDRPRTIVDDGCVYVVTFLIDGFLAL